VSACERDTCWISNRCADPARCDADEVSRPPREEDRIEAAFWRYDTLHTQNRTESGALLGPMSERDAFKRVVRDLLSLLDKDRAR
jgi:hypothetical protein